MLEREEDLDGNREGGQSACYRTVYLDMLVAYLHVIRYVLKHQEAAEDVLFISIACRGQSPDGDPEEGEDLFSFLERYGAWKEEDLAAHILKESEFLHDELCYDEPKSAAYLEAVEREKERLLAEGWTSRLERGTGKS